MYLPRCSHPGVRRASPAVFCGYVTWSQQLSCRLPVLRSVGPSEAVKRTMPLCVFIQIPSLSPSCSSNHGGLPLLCDVTLLTRVPVVCPSILADRLTLTLYRPNPVERIITKKKKKTGPERDIVQLDGFGYWLVFTDLFFNCINFSYHVLKL